MTRTIHPYDEYVLARSLVTLVPDDGPEDDLFAGVRDRVSR